MTKHSSTGAIRAVLGALVLLWAVAACEAKAREFFAPNDGGITNPGVRDVDPPVFSGFLPLSNTGIPANINSFSFNLVDNTGANGAAPSGVDFSSVTATQGGATIPLTRSGNTFTGSLSGMSDGTKTISLSGSDLSGNRSTATDVIILKHTLPGLSVTTKPPATQSSSATSITLTFGGSVTESFLGKVFGGVTKPGPDNQCGTADDTPWPVGTGLGQVSANSWDYTTAVKSGGTFSQSFTAFNGVPSGGSPATGSYCMFVTVQDNAVDASGQPAPNSTTSSFRTDVTWNPHVGSGFTIGLSPSYVHSTGFSTVCIAISTAPAQAGAAFTSQLTGPPGGVSGSGASSGTLDATGKATVKNTILQFGNYESTVTVGSTVNSVAINVTAAPGTCSGP